MQTADLQKRRKQVLKKLDQSIIKGYLVFGCVQHKKAIIIIQSHVDTEQDNLKSQRVLFHILGAKQLESLKS